VSLYFAAEQFIGSFLYISFEVPLTMIDWLGREAVDAGRHGEYRKRLRFFEPCEDGAVLLYHLHQYRFVLVLDGR
jgi:hypothetical protein